MNHIHTTCRDDHTPSESACRMATLELLERTRIRHFAEVSDYITQPERRHLRVVEAS